MSPPRWFWAIVLSGMAGSVWAATPAGTAIVNVASVEYIAGPSILPTIAQSNQTVTLVAAAQALAVTKVAEPAGPVAPGSTLTFSLIVENPGGVNLSSVVISDPLDPLLGPPLTLTTGSVPNDSPSGGMIPVNGSYIAAGRTVRWDVPALPAGARFTLTFTTQVSPLAPEDSVVRNLTTQVSAQDPAGTNSNEVLVPVVTPALSIRKVASRSRAEVGEPVGFAVDVANVSPTLDLHGLEVRDLLPPGLRYVEGSARLDGRRIPDPEGGASRREMLFVLGDLPLGAGRRLSYMTIPDTRAEGNEEVNVARAEALTPGDHPVTAGPAQAAVRVSGSLVPTDSVVVGRVFVDDNHDGFFEEGEVGVPAARVYLEDGTFTLTDVAGKYHVEGVRPGLHVVKVDPATLPEGLMSFGSWTRSAGGAGTQFADTGGADLFKANVATGGWGIAVSRLRARALYRPRERGAPRGHTGDDEELQSVDLPPVLASVLFPPGSADLVGAARPIVEGYAALVRERGGRLVSVEVEPACYPIAEDQLMRKRADRFSAELSRLVLAAAPADGAAPRTASVRGPQPGLTPAASRGAPSELQTLEASVKEMTPEPAILTPAEGDYLRAAREVVEVKLPAGLTPRLKVNSDVVASDQIAVRMETSLTQLVFYRYIGVPFHEGRNSVVLEGLDEWGNARVWIERIVSRVGPPRQVTVRSGEAAPRADARTPIEARVEVRDGEGLPVVDGTLVTVEVDEGEFIGTDASARQEGFQAPTKDGVATVHLTPSGSAGKRTLTAKAEEASGEATFSLEPELRDWIVAGVGEGTIGESAAPDGRLALFARGRLFGSSLMTMSYDSSRERDRDRIFRALAPDRFFPIYGDSSTQGYAVEGQGKFSLRLDQPRSSFALGDFSTGLTAGELTRYDRSLTGGSGRLEMKGFSLQSFGATTPQTQARDELPGAGISGPYRLTRRPLVINSERLMIETRDRFHPERVLSSRVVNRYSDYDVDYEGGTLFFKQPVPFQDDDFNPIVVVAIYETLDAGGDRATVAGGRMGYRFGEGAEIGATYVNESRAGGDFVLRGADFGVKRSFVSGSIEFHGEAATTESAAGEPSGAVSFRASAKVGRSIALGGYYRNVASGFENSSRAGTNDSGTVRYGVESTASLADGSRLKGELFSQSDALRGGDRRVGSLDWERTFGKVTARSGYKDLRAPDPVSGGSALSRLVSVGLSARLTTRMEGLLARQQVVAGSALRDYPTRTTLGLTARITENTSAFLREEYDQADAGDASRTVLGMESHLTRNTVMESRYSLEDALNGARGFAQMGIRTRLPLTQDWLGDLNLERVSTTQGASSGDFTALGIGFEYLPAKMKFTSRYELRLGEQDDTHVLSTAGARRLTDSLSLFTRERIFFVNPDSAPARMDGDGLIGLAYRPVKEDQLNFLFKIQGLKGALARGGGAPEARSYLGVFEMNYQPAVRFHLLGRLALKESVDRFETEGFSSRSWLAEARTLYDITAKLNAGLTLRRLDQTTIGSRLTGLGAETGYCVTKDLWVVGGYNVTGFTESGFGDSDRRAAGPFLSVRFKFDEETLAGLSKRDR
ncbi:MAG TPA: hypothetical protein VGK94_01110 [Candidatus Polarisedimenticolia bacterium]|jgi:uncharacterized repeat protein (TIGR01451 family)